MGTFDRPFIPQIQGAENFDGKAFHRARWDGTVDFKGQNVVVLGNGAPATQFIPEMVKDVGPNRSVTQLVKSDPLVSTAGEFLTMQRTTVLFDYSHLTIFRGSSRTPSRCRSILEAKHLLDSNVIVAKGTPSNAL